MTISNSIFLNKSTLNNHPEMQMGRKVHVYEISNKIFSIGGSLNIYLFTHTGEKDFFMKKTRADFQQKAT